VSTKEYEGLVRIERLAKERKGGYTDLSDYEDASQRLYRRTGGGIVDPLVFELAKTLFAGISAAWAAVQAWHHFRDAHKAAATFDATYREALTSPDASDAAEELAAIIPEHVITDLEGRADSCWNSYRNVLGGDYLPAEVDKATDAVQACVCRELGRIYTLEGSIPPRWQGQWRRFDCENRGKPRGAKLPPGLSPQGIPNVSASADIKQRRERSRGAPEPRKIRH
jgi:hypothetical protein